MTNTITKTTHVKAPIDRVWRAISDHKEFGQWFNVALDQPFQAGQTSTGKITHPGFEHCAWNAEIEAIEPTRRFALRWHPFAIDPDVDYSDERTTLVEFLLEPEADGTRVTITETGFDKLPEARREIALRSNTQGWAAQANNLREYAEARAEA
ncbi:MAG TPA: SRPBCC family protein [Sphingomicrobium sp.]|nr:SRPBCC family protein [Sphingomicrobium sp.]